MRPICRREVAHLTVPEAYNRLIERVASRVQRWAEVETNPEHRAMLVQLAATFRWAASEED